MKMTCTDAVLLLIDYIDNQLNGPVKKELEFHLATCEHCSKELAEYRQVFDSISNRSAEEPSVKLRTGFDRMLRAEIMILESGKPVKNKASEPGSIYPFGSLFLKVAACLLLLAGGVVIGKIFTGNQAQDSTNVEIAALKEEVKGMRESMMFSLLANESASERIRAVSYADGMANPGSEVIDALINTINADQNVNVRLAALNSVSKFSSTPMVRDSLVNALGRQKEPIIQIVLINMLTNSKETRAIGVIKKIISDKNTLAPVKDAAEKGLKQL